jgi:fructose-1,6-bisphosphatase/inositol monophosphatase family enzyme
MIWDVAAGIAIVEGAGGRVHRVPKTIEYSLDVYASNGMLFRAD